MKKAYEISWKETWLRTTVANIDDDEVRKYMFTEGEPVTDELRMEYLTLAANEQEDDWMPSVHPGELYDDDFDKIEVTGVEPAGPGVDVVETESVRGPDGEWVIVSESRTNSQGPVS